MSEWIIFPRIYMMVSGPAEFFFWHFAKMEKMGQWATALNHWFGLVLAIQICWESLPIIRIVLIGAVEQLPIAGVIVFHAASTAVFRITWNCEVRATSGSTFGGNLRSAGVARIRKREEKAEW
jgi:uncharacterized membrane protein